MEAEKAKKAADEKDTADIKKALEEKIENNKKEEAKF